MGTKKKSIIKLLTAMCISVMLMGFAAITGSASDFTSPKESYTFKGSGSKSFTANLTTSNLQEWYKFTLPSDGELTLALTTYVNGRCTLYTSGMTALTNNAFYGRGTSASPAINTVTFSLSKGTYYICSSGNEAGKVIAKVTYKSYNTLSNKSSSQSGAPSVKVGTQYNGALTYTSHEDWYKYTISESGTYTLSITYGFQNVWAPASYYFKNSSLSTTYASGTNYNGTVISETFKLSKGTYYLYFQTKGSDERSQGKVTFKLSKKSSSSSSSSSIKKGSTYTVSGLKCKVTNASTNGSGTVTVTAPSKKSVTSVKIPATVKIKGKSFKVTEISAKAFSNCSSLSKVTIGKNVKTIGKKAFYNCGKLKTIKIKSTKLSSVGSKAFKGIKSTAKIKVPGSKLSAYKKLLKGKGQGSKVKITS